MIDKTDTYTQVRYFCCKDSNMIYRIVITYVLQCIIEVRNRLVYVLRQLEIY